MRSVDEQISRPRDVRRDLLVLVALALAWRLAFMLAMRRVIDSPDAILYLGLAKSYAAGDLLAPCNRIPPLYPALTALVNLAVPDIELAARIVSLLAGSMVAAPVYLLCRDAWRGPEGAATARIAGIAVCLWTWLADYGSRVAPDALTLTLWFTAVWALARCLRRGGWWTAWAPLAFLGLHLARPEGILLWFAAPLGGALLCLGGRRDRWRRLALFLGFSVLLIASFAVYMRFSQGMFSYSYRVTDTAGALQNAFVERGRELLYASLVTIFENVPIMSGPFLLLFAGVGCFRPSPRPDGDTPGRDLRLEAFVVYFGATQLGAAIISTMAEPRYIMAVVVVIALWAARGMALVSAQAAALPRHRWLRKAPVGILVALMAVGTVTTIIPEYLGRVARMPREYKTAGRWMRDNLEPGLVFARNPQLGFYAGMPTTGPATTDTLEESLQRAHDAGARYLVVDERYVDTKTPAWRPLLDPANAPPCLRLLRDDLSPFDAARVVIYELAEGTAAPREGP